MPGKKPRSLEAGAPPGGDRVVAEPVRSVIDALPARVSDARLGTRNGAAYVAALRRRFSPDDLPEMIAEAYRSAYMVGDAKTMLEAARLIANYTAGKPASMDSGAGAGANALQVALAAWVSGATAQRDQQQQQQQHDDDALTVDSTASHA